MTTESNIADARGALQAIDKKLVELWHLGSRFVAGWTLDGATLIVAMSRIADLPKLAADEPALLRGEKLDVKELVRLCNRSGLRMEEIPAGPWWASPAMLAALETAIGRYAIRRTEFHAMARIEVERFRDLPTAMRIAQLATLSHSINIAAERMEGSGSDIDLGRAPTGEGYRLWNRRQGWKADIDLFCLLSLALAENGLARARDAGTAPVVKAAFAVGDGWEFSLPRGGGSPAIHNDVLGEIEDETQHLLEAALPGQILIGAFQRPMADGPPRKGMIYKLLDAPRFVGLAQRRLGDFDNVMLGAEKVAGIKLYLTGDEIGPGTFDIKAFGYPMAQSRTMEAFNVKLNIHRPDRPPFFFGLQHKDLRDVAPCRAYHLDSAPRDYMLPA
ncbi:MAG: hypothetical protein ACKOEE_00625 [Tagaea sp.]